MTAFTIAVFISLAVSSAFGSRNPSLRSIPERDQWYRIPEEARLTDLPRIFDRKIGCPAKSFYLDCNRCNCPDGSTQGACTRMACDPAPQIVNFGVSKSCPPGRPFYWKCNECVCDENGKDADCTRKACPDYSKPEQE